MGGEGGGGGAGEGKTVLFVVVVDRNLSALLTVEVQATECANRGAATPAKK